MCQGHCFWFSFDQIKPNRLKKIFSALLSFPQCKVYIGLVLGFLGLYKFLFNPSYPFFPPGCQTALQQHSTEKLEFAIGYLAISNALLVVLGPVPSVLSLSVGQIRAWRGICYAFAHLKSCKNTGWFLSGQESNPRATVCVTGAHSNVLGSPGECLPSLSRIRFYPVVSARLPAVTSEGVWVTVPRQAVTRWQKQATLAGHPRSHIPIPERQPKCPRRTDHTAGRAESPTCWHAPPS